MFRRAGQTRLADRNGPIAILLKLRQVLSDTDALRARNDAERPILHRPTPLLRVQELICDGLSHQACDETELAGLLSGAARQAGSSEEYGTARRLLREALEESIDHQSAETVSDEMNPGRFQGFDEALQSCGNLRHGGVGSGITERVHLQTELIREPAAQKKRLAARHPQPMNVNDIDPSTAQQP